MNDLFTLVAIKTSHRNAFNRPGIIFIFRNKEMEVKRTFNLHQKISTKTFLFKFLKDMTLDPLKICTHSIEDDLKKELLGREFKIKLNRGENGYLNITSVRPAN